MMQDLRPNGAPAADAAVNASRLVTAAAAAIAAVGSTAAIEQADIRTARRRSSINSRQQSAPLHPQPPQQPLQVAMQPQQQLPDPQQMELQQQQLQLQPQPATLQASALAGHADIRPALPGHALVTATGAAPMPNAAAMHNVGPVQSSMQGGPPVSAQQMPLLQRQEAPRLQNTQLMGRQSAPMHSLPRPELPQGASQPELPSTSASLHGAPTQSLRQMAAGHPLGQSQQLSAGQNSQQPDDAFVDVMN